MPRFYMDEDLPDRAALIVRALGGDASSVRELGRDGLSDDDQLRFAAELGRALVSRNERDFVPKSKLFAAEGLPHAGVLIVTRSIDNRDARSLARALLAYDREHPGDMLPHMVDYLTRAKD